jgi:hypothetical protein
MINEAKIEFCLVAEYANGDKFCIAKFMHEDDARNYKRSRRKKEYVVYRLYRRTEKHTGEVTWEEL